jgi:gliding motility-associated-like protein
MIHTYIHPGAYVPKLILSDNTGCQNSTVGTDTIKVDAVTGKFSTVPNPACLNTPFNFVDSSGSYWSTISSWVWTYNGITSTLTSPSYTFTTTGTYPVNLKVTDGWGCFAIVDNNVTIYPPPVVTASADTVVCVSDSAKLFAYGANTYAWFPDPSLGCLTCNPTKASPSVVTMYTVTGTDIHGCTDTATTTVGLRTLTIAKAWGDTAVCFGTPVHLFDTGGYFYKWYPSRGLSQDNIGDPIATPPVTTNYMVVARLGSCIPDTDYVVVTVWPLPSVDAGPDQRILAGMTAQLHATGTLISTYAWSPSETLSCDDCPSPVASMSVMTTYKIDVYTDHGCHASDSVKILIYCDNSQVFVPNAFTPNGDGQNDVFYPRGIGIKTIKSFRIYNRWGELLFEREGINLNDADNAWDGTYKGGTPRPDVYVYIIDAVCFTGDPVFIKGDVTIIR